MTPSRSCLKSGQAAGSTFVHSILAATTVITLALGFTAVPGPAWSGPNQGGYLILHANPNLTFTTEMPWPGSSDLRDCREAVTTVPGDGKQINLFVMAVFDNFASPQVAGLTFGIDYSTSQIRLHDGGAFGQVPTLDGEMGWPRAGSGVTVAWGDGDEKTDRVNEIYWFSCYAVDGATVSLVPHPRAGGQFCTRSFPKEYDDIEGYGTIGFGTPGINPCASDDATGACCSSEGSCFIQSRNVCTKIYGYGYTYLGDGTDCFPNKCIPGMGACCVRADCYLLPWNECLDAGGMFMGESSACDPTPCNFSTVPTTWGVLKDKYHH
jgi:hypothetical protein